MNTEVNAMYSFCLLTAGCIHVSINIGLFIERGNLLVPPSTELPFRCGDVVERRRGEGVKRRGSALSAVQDTSSV